MVAQVRSPNEQIKTTQIAHSAAVVSKTPVVIGGKVLFPLHDAAANEMAAYVYEAEVSGLPKASGAIAALAKVYWDAAAGAITATSTNNTLIGYALEPMASAVTVSGLIAFNAFAA